MKIAALLASLTFALTLAACGSDAPASKAEPKGSANSAAHAATPHPATSAKPDAGAAKDEGAGW